MVESLLAFLIGLIARIAQDAIVNYRRQLAERQKEEANVRMLEAGADRPRSRDDLAGRMHDGTF